MNSAARARLAALEAAVAHQAIARPAPPEELLTNPGELVALYRARFHGAAPDPELNALSAHQLIDRYQRQLVTQEPEARRKEHLMRIAERLRDAFSRESSSFYVGAQTHTPDARDMAGHSARPYLFIEHVRRFLFVALEARLFAGLVEAPRLDALGGQLGVGEGRQALALGAGVVDPSDLPRRGRSPRRTARAAMPR